ncbi:hypothetical protein P4C99_09420 [Pontiellaceae bacterium B1224]|nr:hypothetical protein [Pontiellaceae bacterium B1224]
MKIKILLLVMLCVNAFAAQKKASSEELEFVVSGWAAWMRGAVIVNGQKAKVHRDSEDYFNDLNYGGSGELILRNSSMVLLGAVDYFDNISSDVTVNGQQGSLDSSELIGCIAVGYPLGSGYSTMDFFIGLQTLRMDNTLQVTGSTKQSQSTDIYDVVFMMRLKQELFSNCYLNIPLSLGGGYLSDSEFVYDVAVQLMYQFGDSFDVRAGYRISGYDFSEDASATDFYQQGYTLGLGMTF